MFAGVDYLAALNGTADDRIRILLAAIEHTLTLPVVDKNGAPIEGSDRKLSKKRFTDAASRLIGGEARHCQHSPSEAARSVASMARTRRIYALSRSAS